MTNETYNGWHNRETWATALWINNTAGLREDAREAIAGKSGVEADDALRDFMESLYDDFAENPTPKACPMWNDIGSMWRVVWKEITDSLTEE